MNKFKHLVKYGLFKRIKSKAFLIANIVIGIIVLGVIVVPTIIQLLDKSESTPDVEVVTNLVLVNETSNNTIISSLTNIIDSNNTNSELIIFNYTEKDSLDIDNFYESEDEFDGAIIISENNNVYSLIVENKSIDPSIIPFFQLLLPELNRYEFLKDNNEYADQITNSIVEFRTAPSGESEFLDMVLLTIGPLFIVPVLLLIILGVQYVGVDIIEEKSSKAIEVIISSVQPIIHFLSKIIYVLLFLLIQIGIIFGVAMIGLLLNTIITGSSGLAEISALFGDVDIMGTIIIMLISSVLGTVLYLVLASFIASLSVNQEDFQQVQTPLMMIIMFGYLGAIFATLSNAQTLIMVLSYIPFTSPFILPIAYLSGGVGILEIIISLIILTITIGLVAYIFAPLYRASILNYDQSKLWKRIKNSFKNAKSLRKKK